MALDFTSVWLDMLEETLLFGSAISPRNRKTKEILHRTILVDMRQPVLLEPKRKLSYKFMAAEAFWILTGDDAVAGIAPYNAAISQFSDDGVVFYGAYGPKIVGQLDYIVSKLRQDPSTRQAGLTIWRENPPETKDVPCTVAIFFSLRNNMLNAHVFMRSSDIWLGVPYDVFNFSMLAHLVCCRLNEDSAQVIPGGLFLTAVSSHLYEDNLDSAKACLDGKGTVRGPQFTPRDLYTNESTLLLTLENLRTSSAGDSLRWWEHETY